MTGSISVIIPCYNAASLIGAAIDSVYAQTALHLVREIIVVDDGSIDGSADVVRAHRRAAPPLHYEFQQNAGAAAARNRGIAVSTAPLIAFLDADDVWLPEKLAVQGRFIADYPRAGLYFSDFIRAGRREQRVRCRQFTQDDRNAQRQLYVHGGPIIPSTAVLRRSVLEDAGGFDTSLRTKEDPDLWLRIAARAPLQRVPVPLVRKREVEGSLSSDVVRNAEVNYQITQKAAREFPDLQPFRRHREARIDCKVGYDALRRGAAREARTHFTRAVRKDPRFYKPYVYLALTLLPVSGAGRDALARQLKRARAWIRGMA